MPSSVFPSRTFRTFSFFACPILRISAHCAVVNGEGGTGRGLYGGWGFGEITKKVYRDDLSVADNPLSSHTLALNLQAQGLSVFQTEPLESSRRTTTPRCLHHYRGGH